MLCKEYITNELLLVQQDDVVNEVWNIHALTLTDTWVVEDNEHKFAGFINKEHLLHPEDKIIKYAGHFYSPHVKAQQPILYALQLMHTQAVPYIAVLDTTFEYLGEISRQSMVMAMYDYLSVTDGIGGIIVLEINPVRYSITEIVQIVHSANADIIQYNTRRNAQNGHIIVSLVLSKKDVSLAVATFQRYEYTVNYYFGEQSYDNEIQSNYDLLMKYINI